jgi:hypothetical protein
MIDHTLSDLDIQMNGHRLYKDVVLEQRANILSHKRVISSTGRDEGLYPHRFTKAMAEGLFIVVQNQQTPAQFIPANMCIAKRRKDTAGTTFAQLNHWELVEPQVPLKVAKLGKYRPTINGFKFLAGQLNVSKIGWFFNAQSHSFEQEFVNIKRLLGPVLYQQYWNDPRIALVMAEAKRLGHIQ